MTSIHAVGIDPGLVDTGLVRVLLKPASQVLEVEYAVVKGMDPLRYKQWIDLRLPEPLVFIEKYRPRSNFGTDERMVQGERDFRVTLPKATLLTNTGIRSVVKPAVLQAMDLWQFRLPTHHQDLRSAARILVLGLMKHEQGNTVLADLICAELDGDPWQILNHGGKLI